MEKKLIGIFVCILFVGSIIPASGNILNYKAFNPAKVGIILYVGGSGPGNYSSIQDAIDNSSDGDTIFVYDDNSPYYENINIDKSINLIGEKNETTVIDGQGVDTIFIEADFISIKNFNIQNATNYNAGIKIFNNNSVIENNIITKNTYGIKLQYTGNNSIINNYIYNNGQIGIVSDYSNNNTIQFNKIENNVDYGIHFDDCKNNYILDNNISNKAGGIKFFSGSHFNIISNNILRNIYIAECNYNIISNNTIHDETYDGIHFSTWNHYNEIYGNTIYGCLIGISLGLHNIQNIIYHNNLINNNHNADGSDDQLNIWDNGYPSGGNYYSDYTGNDSYHGPNQDILGSDGIGDTPYKISDEDSYDNFPLMKPFGTPDAPIVTGRRLGKTGKSYTYTFVSHDTENNPIKYYVDWGDNTSTGWTEEYKSGEEVTISHTWYEKGTYMIRAKAMDISTFESNWGILTVTMPRSRILNIDFFLQFLQNHPNMFPLIRSLLKI